MSALTTGAEVVCYFLPFRNGSCGNVLHLSVILFTGVVCMAGGMRG